MLVPLFLIFLLPLFASFNPFEELTTVFKHIEKHWGLLIIPITIIGM